MSLRPLITILFPVLLAMCSNSYAQYTAPAWKKLVAREINVTGKVDERMRAKDSSLADMLIKAIRSGKITAYSNFDSKFTYKLTPTEINEMFLSKPDTQNLIDPATGYEVTKVITRDVNYSTIHKYRILEEWSFDREKGCTDIHIIGIAPLLDIYGDYGDYRGIKALFWVKYNEAANIIVRHHVFHTGLSLPEAIWKDYFPTNTKAAESTLKNGIWKRHNTRILNIDPENTKKHHLNDMSSDSSLSDLITNIVVRKELNIYDSTGKKLSLSDMLPKPDTTVLVDPITRNDVMKIIKHEPYYGYDVKYKLIEEWSFDELKGSIQMKIAQVVPILEKDDKNSKHQNEDLYRLKFDDISAILAKYEQGHYNHSLANLLWNDYFLDEVKPVTKK